ncbi:hypothetical protein LTR29_009717 [Friedmanniomyces endolithicus]|nr:hypothetical protein LTR29_009717 [Friedmanniomyces endolithicus]
MSPTPPKHEARELTAEAQARATRERMSELEAFIRSEVNEMRAACGEAPHPMPPGLKVTVEVGQGPSSGTSSRAAVLGEMSSKPAETLRRKRPATDEHSQHLGPATLTRAAVAGDAADNPVNLTESDAPETKLRRTRQYPPSSFPQHRAPAVARPHSPAAYFSTARTWPPGGPAAYAEACGRFLGAGMPTSMPATVPGMTATAAMPAMRRRAPLCQPSARSSGGATAAAVHGIPAATIPATLRVCCAAAARFDDPADVTLPSSAKYVVVRIPAVAAGSYEDLVSTTGAFGQSHNTEMPASPSAFGPSQQPALVGPLPPSPQDYGFGTQLQSSPRAQSSHAYHGDQRQQPFMPPLPLSSPYAGYDMQPLFSPDASFPPMGFREPTGPSSAQAQSQPRPERRGSRQGAGSAEWYRYVPESLQDSGSSRRNAGRARGLWRSDAEDGSGGQSGANERSGSRYGR